MAAEVEVQTGEVGRTMAGARLHLSPLTDSSNKSLMEIPSVNQSHIIATEPNKPTPTPKPRLTPKPFAVEKNPTIRPILAPKPQTKPRPVSTHLAGYKPDLPSTPKPTPRQVSTNPSRPAPTSFKTSNKFSSGQTVKPVVQPFKTAPPLDHGDVSKPAETEKPIASSLAYSKSLKKVSAAEWSGTTNKDETLKKAQNKAGASITRAKSMGFLAQIGKEEEEKDKAQPDVSVRLRPQSRSSRPRPVSAVFPCSPTKGEASVPAPRSAERRPLSADLTSKFESIGLSLHRKSPQVNTKENTPEDKALPQEKEPDKSITPQSTEGVADPPVTDQSNKKTEESTVKETEEDKRGASIKMRISLLLDSSCSPGAAAADQVSDLPSPVQPAPEAESPVGVKQLIKQLTDDTTPTPIPVVKPALKPRPLPLDLTKRFSSERSPDLVPLTEAADRHEISKDPQRGDEGSAVTPKDQRVFLDLTESPEQLSLVSMSDGSETGQKSVQSGEVHTVRASVFENIVERHSVLMMDEGKSVNAVKDATSSPLFKTGEVKNEGTLVTAAYREPVSPSNPLRVSHAFDTVQAVEENRAVSESVPSAQWEDKAATLRSRRSDGSRAAPERTDPGQVQPALATTPQPQPQPRYLRVGALQKWTNAGLDQDAGLPVESGRGPQTALDNNDGDRQRMVDEDEVAAAPKRLKMLQTEEQPKPRATFFALTGQMQEPSSPGHAGTSFRDATVPFDDFSARSVLIGTQGKVAPVRRKQSLEEAFGKSSYSQEHAEALSPMEIRSQMDEQTKEERTDAEKRVHMQESERLRTKMKNLERETQKQLEIEKQAQLEFARMKEMEMQREYERQRQRVFEKEKQELEEKRHALERQKQIELEKQKRQELEKLREIEKERQMQIEKEKRQELETQRELERERQRQKEEERQRELDRERRLLEIQKEKQKMEEMERIKELERQQLLEFQRQKQKERERQQLAELERQNLREKKEREEAEKLRQVALEQEMLRIKEIEKEKAKQREMEREKQRELERRRQKELEREKQKQLDIRQELENQKLRQREKEKQRKDEQERIQDVARRQLMEFEKQNLELEKFKLKEKMEKEEAEKMRLIAKQQEAERQRLKEKQKREDQERLRLESSALRPKVLDLDSVLRDDPPSKASPPRNDPATRWREPYKPAILDIDSFTSHAQVPSVKDSFTEASGVQGLNAEVGVRLQPERDGNWKTSGGISSPVWITSPQDPWELRPVEMPVDNPVAEPRRPANKTYPEQLLLRQEERPPNPQRSWAGFLNEPLAPGPAAPFPGPEVRNSNSCGGLSGSGPGEQIWVPRVPHPPQEARPDVGNPRRSQGSQELNRMRSRSVSRRSAPSNSVVEGSLFRMRSRSAHREQGRDSWVQQKQGGEEQERDSETPVPETDSQYGTWETGLRTDDSLTPATPSSDSNLSSSPRKATSPHTPDEETDGEDLDVDVEGTDFLLGDLEWSSSSVSDSGDERGSLRSSCSDEGYSSASLLRLQDSQERAKPPGCSL
ncbi:titin homolog [Cololabis saira]|uniref:titin homolog n=1 Tax=Cololabis saira TaxID=129043 RepID=UPI002AD339F6|nr:titin homolog [Cololabis saira]